MCFVIIYTTYWHLSFPYIVYFFHSYVPILCISMIPATRTPPPLMYFTYAARQLSAYSTYIYRCTLSAHSLPPPLSHTYASYPATNHYLHPLKYLHGNIFTSFFPFLFVPNIGHYICYLPSSAMAKIIK
jgi:hypothetical protein